MRPVPATFSRQAGIVVLTALAGLATGCATTSSDGLEAEDDTPSTVVTDLPPIDAVASLGYPRDLLDRGRVNIKISRDDDTDFVILDKRLVADHFTPAPVEERRTVVPPNGRTVAVQTLFGDVSDCASPAPVAATLDITFTLGDDPTHRTASIPLTDATTLDAIRFQRCTVRQVTDQNAIELRDAVVDGETMTVDLVVTRREGTSRLGLDTIKGTVLFGASTTFGGPCATPNAAIASSGLARRPRNRLIVKTTLISAEPLMISGQEKRQ